MIMAKEFLNEAERFLVEHWVEAQLLEESMEGVRTKYKEIFQRIIKAVTEAHPELDANRAIPIQRWSSGEIGFGRKSWPIDKYGNPSGFWFGSLLLEKLAAEDSEDPYASIWVSKKTNLDFDAARAAVNEAAQELLTPEELKQIFSTESGDENLLYLPAPSKRQLLDALFEGDGHKFIELFLAQFDMTARFVPLLDKVFRECLKKE